MTVNEAWLSVLCSVSSRSVTKANCKITQRNNKASISASAYLSSIVFIVLYLLLLLFKTCSCGPLQCKHTTLCRNGTGNR